MQALIFTGIQASGKSSFYRHQFFYTHVRLSLDLLRTREREAKFLDLCLKTNTRFVVDNTNPTRAERQVYIAKANAHHFEVVGFFFETPLADALIRNRGRTGKERIKDIGLYDCQKKLETPTHQEGFDRVFSVRLIKGEFVVEEIPNASKDDNYTGSYHV